MEEIDESWTHEFRELENPYNAYYKDEVYSIKLYFLYVNSSREIVSMKSERIMLDEVNLLHSTSIVQVIKEREHCDNIKYKLRSLLKYNIDVDPDDALSNLEGINPLEYAQEVSYSNHIYFKDTIHTFQDLNSLFFLFQESNPTRSKIKGSRKVQFHSNNRKTRRKNI